MRNNQSSLRNTKFRIHSRCSVDSSQSASIRLRRTIYKNISRTVFYSSSVGSTSGISHHSQARFHEETQENFLGFTFRTRWLLKTKNRTFSQNPRNTGDLKNDYIIAYNMPACLNPCPFQVVSGNIVFAFVTDFLRKKPWAVKRSTFSFIL